MDLPDYIKARHQILTEYDEENQLSSGQITEFLELEKGNDLNQLTLIAYMSYVSGKTITETDFINGLCHTLQITPQPLETIPRAVLLPAIYSLTNRFLTRI